MTDNERNFEQDFERTFGRKPRFAALASGRVNIIGEHTDYNDGFVLPTTIPQYTRVWAEPTDTREVRLASANLPGAVFNYRLGQELRTQEWTDYIQGITRLLAEGGFAIDGFDLLVASDVPIGSGLSSSAALEVAVFRVLRDAFGIGEGLDDVAIARLCQRVENEFVGARVGIMDPMAASLAGQGIALFIDTRTLQFERVPIPTRAMELVVIHSGVSHRNVGGGYNQRRSECEQACALLGISSLRDLGLTELAQLNTLPDVLHRRARHVITENARVLEAVDCLRRSDVKRLGELLRASHASMRDDYEVSIPEIDILVDIANHDIDIIGSRLTGGGFGGSIVALARPGRATEAAIRVCAEYKRSTLCQPKILVPQNEATRLQEFGARTGDAFKNQVDPRGIPLT